MAFFLAAYCRYGRKQRLCGRFGEAYGNLRMSAKASSIAVTRAGAVPSIPYRAEVMEALAEA